MTITPEFAADEIRGAIAVLAGLHQVLAGEMDNAAFGQMAQGIIDEHFPTEPTGFIIPLAYVCLRAVGMAAATLGGTVPELLQHLALESIPPE